jgi:3-methyladenine DNA glycosylase/8-oxoguanine DNA glycosylase
MLQLDRDLSAFYALAREEPHLAHVEQAAKGRILRSPTLFEDTVKTILTTNTSWGGTRRMTGALVAQLGSPLPGDPEHRAFPTPRQIASVDEAFLREETKLGYRAPRVLGLAQDVASGRVDLEGLKDESLPTDEVRGALLAIKGVGPYAAASLLALLGRFDDVPVDSWARAQVSKHLYDGEPVTKAQVRRAFARWGKWRALAYWFWNWDA